MPLKQLCRKTFISKMLLLENIKDVKSVSFHLKKLEKKNKLNTKKQKKRNNKIKVEINEIENKVH